MTTFNQTLSRCVIFTGAMLMAPRVLTRIWGVDLDLKATGLPGDEEYRFIWNLLTGPVAAGIALIVVFAGIVAVIFGDPITGVADALRVGASPEEATVEPELNIAPRTSAGELRCASCGAPHSTGRWSSKCAYCGTRVAQ